MDLSRFFPPPAAARAVAKRTIAKVAQKRSHEKNGSGDEVKAGAEAEGWAPDYLVPLRRRVMRRLANTATAAAMDGRAEKRRKAEAATDDGAPPLSPALAKSRAAAGRGPAADAKAPAEQRRTSGQCGVATGTECCAACDAPAQWCVCRVAGSSESKHQQQPPSQQRLQPPPQQPPSQQQRPQPPPPPQLHEQEPTRRPAAAVRPAWICRGSEGELSEDDRQLQRDMLRQLVTLEKAGVWLTAAGNKKGIGARGSTCYCRTPREFSVHRVRQVMQLAREGHDWGDGVGVFRHTARTSKRSSYDWKRLAEGALERLTGEPTVVITNGELIMGFCLAGIAPSFGPKGRRQVNATFKAATTNV